MITLPSVQARYSDLLFNAFTEVNGLASNNVTCFIEDAEGYIWIGTENGLSRFDGYNFKTYVNDTRDTTSLIHNHVLTLFLGSDGKLYVGTQYGICVYEKEYDRFVQIQIGYVNGFIRGFYEEKGKVYAIIDRGEIMQVEGNRLQLKYETNTYTHSYLKGEGDVHWFGGDNGLYKFHSGSGKMEHFTLLSPDEDDKVIVFALEENKGKLWIGTRDHGVIIFDIANHSHKKLDYILPFVKAIKKDDEGNVFVGDTEGYKIFNNNYKLLVEHKPYRENGIGTSGNAVNAIYFDTQGNIWLGVKFKGVLMAYPNKGFRDLFKGLHSFLPEVGAISSICVDADDDLWLGFYSNGIAEMNFWNRKIDYHQCNSLVLKGLQCGTVSELYLDRDSVLWIGNYFGGMQRLLPGNRSVQHLSPGLFRDDLEEVDDIRSICQDKQGAYYFATHGSGLLKWNREKGDFKVLRHSPEDPSSIDSDWIFHVICDSRGDIWIASSYGVYVLRDDHVFRKFFYIPGDQNSIPSNQVFTVFEDSQQRIWVGTRRGLCRYRRESEDFENYTTKEGLVDDFVCAMLEDDKGKLWVSTKGGLSCLDPETENFTNYDESDDIKDQEFMENSCAKTSSGHLIFGSVNGGTWFHPDSIRENTVLPQVYITDFKIFNESVPIKPGVENSILSKHIQYTKEVVIDHKQKMIAFDFVALNYNHPEHNEFAYMLENFDKDWIMVKGKREATYTNLPPGNYVFRVKAANNDGYWNDEGVALKLTVKPPFWSTWFFRLGLIALFLALTFFIYYLRVQRIRAINKVLEKIVDQRTKELREMNGKLQGLNATKDKFFSIISHDLINPMNTIRGFSELFLISHNKIDEEKKVSYVQHVFQTSEKTLSLLTDLLKWAKSQSGTLNFNPEKIDVAGLVDDTLSLYQELAEKKKIKFEINIQENYQYAHVDGNMIRAIIRNLISNALKFTPKDGGIIVRSGPADEEGFLRMEIADTGVGILPEDIEQLFKIEHTITTKGTDGEDGSGLGLILCKEFVEKHGGKIWVHSTSGKGSSFYFTLPLEK